MKSIVDCIAEAREFWDGINPTSSDELVSKIADLIEEKEEEIQKCKTRMHSMYNSIRDASLKFLLNSNISNDDKELFKKCFEFYMKNKD